MKFAEILSCQVQEITQGQIQREVGLEVFHVKGTAAQDISLQASSSKGATLECRMGDPLEVS